MKLFVFVLFFVQTKLQIQELKSSKQRLYFSPAHILRQLKVLCLEFRVSLSIPMYWVK